MNAEPELSSLLDESVTEEQLYEMLADSAGLGADEINKSAEGKTLFSRVWKRSQDKVCGNKMIQAYIGDPNTADATAITGHLVNLLIGIKGLNVGIVAVLAVRLGLRTLCKNCGQ